MKNGRWIPIRSLNFHWLRVFRYSFRITAVLIFALTGIANAASFGECSSERTSTLIDRDWTFHLGDVAGAQAVSYSDESWEHVNIPHSFSIPYFLSPQVYSGYGWYRKKLNITCRDQGKRYFLEFDGVFRVAEIYVNGSRLREHDGGYTGFSIDITNALLKGENVLAVRVNNLWNAQLNPRAGEHVFSGGIYRHVRLVETSNLHVTWYGTFVTTPNLNEDSGDVHINTEIRNESADTSSFVLKTAILDPEGRLIKSLDTRSELAGETIKSIDQDIFQVHQPQLWSPNHPSLYTVVTTILRSGIPVDRYRTTFGFRSMKWTADKGFFLNGKHWYFHGANVHQDHAGWGDAVSDDGVARDIHMIKEAGMDFIRGSHYPHSPVFADECDRQGMLLWSEISFWGIGGQHKEGTWTASAYPPNEVDQKAFEESLKTSLAEMVRINRNHPSIVAWSMGNEVFFSDSPLMPKIRVLLKALVQESHALDPSRPAAIGGVQRGEIDHIGDIAGYNGDGARLFLNPGLPNFVSEYGSTISDRPGKYDPGFGDLEGQSQFSWRSGQVIWCGFDHGSVVPDLAHMGIIDYFRLPKRAWYWYRNAYTGIAPPEWPAPGIAKALSLTSETNVITRADGRGSVHLVISVLDAKNEEISNTPPVKLEIISGPGELPTGRSIVFDSNSDIAILDGKAAIELRAYESGEIHLRASSPGLKSAELIIKSEGGPLFIPGKTRITSARSYTSSSGAPVLGAEMNASLNHPTKASSELPGHEARFANDDDLASYWEPAKVDSGDSWWQLEFENRVQLQSVQVKFKDGEDLNYEVQMSEDGKVWRPLATHKTASGLDTNELTSVPPDKRIGVFLRINFQDAPPDSIHVTDVRIMGRAVFQKRRSAMSSTY